MKVTRSLILSASIVAALASCGGSTDPQTNPTPETPTTPQPPARDWWDVDAPDYSASPERPSISLIGDNVLQLSVGENYVESGATAQDNEDGDLSAQIVMTGEVDTANVGDYFVRYAVTDSDGNYAVDKIRFIRVVAEQPVNYSLRPLGDFQVNMGYVEYLPTQYGLNPQQKHPLIIYHHGNGANADFSPSSNPKEALQLVLNNYGPATLMMAGRWDKSLPFIVLSPQGGVIQDSDVPARIDTFVEHALRTYNVDPNRVYMMGWSQGGFVSIEYAIKHPEKLAAVIPMAAGTPFIDAPPADFCQLETLPIWAFHGRIDGVIPYESSVNLRDYLVNDCQPTTLPKVTIFEEEGHSIHHFISDLSAMSGGRFEYIVNDAYDPFDVSIYNWLLQFESSQDGQ